MFALALAGWIAFCIAVIAWIPVYLIGWKFGHNDGRDYRKSRESKDRIAARREAQWRRELAQQPPWFTETPAGGLPRVPRQVPSPAASLEPMFTTRPGTRIPGQRTQPNPIPSPEPDTGMTPRVGSITEEFAAITAAVNTTAANALREIREGK